MSAAERERAAHCPRMVLAERVPEVYRALVRLDAAAQQGVDATLRYLVKVRVSQLNGCAFCVDMHSKDALANGESVERLMQLTVWEESRHFYTEREVAAIELAEAMTRLTEGPVSDEVYGTAAKLFGETELARLISVITVINAWNRIGVTTRMVAGTYQPGDAG
ncbi:carboxymuconolactone decarboxylase family protein [Streptomyces sp. V2]|uniref:Carboxymuconolactone decarboxylase family protein n=1 Tax=Streptomyces niveiscabiei TaxID=164115 RepID=A0ABW9I349_9ACTN|nr:MULTISPECIES: carboxymuconolactone decarboxylase family protein [Streptomyces]PWG07702.1 carboxymuconolactone decarboxylase family protein [Streptomyces sp. V2]QZZ29734.1 carboxymuconolactone decarboxylase family protein [Streptomyces sp. ST1015]